MQWRQPRERPSVRTTKREREIRKEHPEGTADGWVNESLQGPLYELTHA